MTANLIRTGLYLTLIILEIFVHEITKLFDMFIYKFPSHTASFRISFSMSYTCSCASHCVDSQVFVEKLWVSFISEALENYCAAFVAGARQILFWSFRSTHIIDDEQQQGRSLRILYTNEIVFNIQDGDEHIFPVTYSLNNSFQCIKSTRWNSVLFQLLESGFLPTDCIDDAFTTKWTSGEENARNSL